jgi:hypothetical protein
MVHDEVNLRRRRQVYSACTASGWGGRSVKFSDEIQISSLVSCSRIPYRAFFLHV